MRMLIRAPRQAPLQSAIAAWLAAAPSFERMLAVLLYFSMFFGGYNGAMVAALTEVLA